MSESEDLRRKRLRYRSTYRGNKELDLLLGAFARTHLDGLSGPALAAYEALLEAGDQDLYDWIVGRRPAPAEHRNEVMTLLKGLRFTPSGS